MGTKTKARNEKVSIGWKWVTVKKKDQMVSLLFESPDVFWFYKAKFITEDFYLFLFFSY